jgi:hypothetical protein
VPAVNGAARGAIAVPQSLNGVVRTIDFVEKVNRFSLDSI